jgi:peptidyl-prolyl cis-trans isomerase SurA
MTPFLHRSGRDGADRRLYAFAAQGSRLLAATILAAFAWTSAQAAQTRPAAAPSSAPSSPNSSLGERISLDRVVAVVNGDLILESDVEAEQRFAAFEPFSVPEPASEDKLIDRLIDRDLILQQLRLQPVAPIPDADLDAQLLLMRKALPQCAAYHCDTDAGWQKFVADQGFTMEELRERWRERMELLEFVEQRFRMGIRILPAEIDAYYKNTMLPAYKKQNAPPPTEASLSDRIQEILLQQRVTDLLDDWLKALRAQGSVRMMKTTEAQP